MILYHGSTMEVSQPHILKSEIGRDFGFAFYTTDIQAQAERWARRRAMIESRRTKRRFRLLSASTNGTRMLQSSFDFCSLTARAWNGWSWSLPAEARRITLTAMTLSRARLQTTMSAKRFPTSCRGSCAKKTPSSGCGLSSSTIKSRFARKWLCARFIFRTAISAGV